MWLFHEEAKRISDFDTFLEYIYNLLKEQTELVLFKISEFFAKELHYFFDEELEKLQKSLSKRLTSQSLSVVTLFITDCKRSVQNELFEITNWFKVSKLTVHDKLDVATIIECGYLSHNLKNPSLQVTPRVEIKDNSILSNYESHIYIFQILLNNIVTHSKLPVDQLSVKIMSYLDDGWRFFSFTNCINMELIQGDQLKNRFLKVKDNWSRDINFSVVNTEGGTGFEKIKKILAYDLKSGENSFDFQVENEELTITLGYRVIYDHERDTNTAYRR